MPVVSLTGHLTCFRLHDLEIRMWPLTGGHTSLLAAASQGHWDRERYRCRNAAEGRQLCFLEVGSHSRTVTENVQKGSKDLSFMHPP